METGGRKAIKEKEMRLGALAGTAWTEGSLRKDEVRVRRRVSRWAKEEGV